LETLIPESCSGSSGGVENNTGDAVSSLSSLSSPMSKNAINDYNHGGNSLATGWLLTLNHSYIYHKNVYINLHVKCFAASQIVCYTTAKSVK